MRNRIVTIVLTAAAVIAFAVGSLVVVRAPHGTPKDASVGSPCTKVFYRRASDNNIYKVFIYCPAGTTHSGFYARADCTTGTARGAVQTNPGPFYGSTATCAGNGIMAGATAIFV